MLCSLTGKKETDANNMFQVIKRMISNGISICSIRPSHQNKKRTILYQTDPEPHQSRPRQTRKDLTIQPGQVGPPEQNTRQTATPFKQRYDPQHAKILTLQSFNLGLQQTNDSTSANYGTNYWGTWISPMFTRNYIYFRVSRNEKRLWSLVDVHNLTEMPATFICGGEERLPSGLGWERALSPPLSGGASAPNSPSRTGAQCCLPCLPEAAPLCVEVSLWTSLWTAPRCRRQTALPTSPAGTTPQLPVTWCCDNVSRVQRDNLFSQPGGRLASILRTTLMPLPPPPYAALKITGIPCFRQKSFASSSIEIGPGVPGTTATPARKVNNWASCHMLLLFINCLLASKLFA